MTQLSSDRFVTYIFHRHSRRAIALAAATLVSWILAGRGWPWWAWLPAAILATGASYALLLMAVYGYHKATYQLRAQRMREQLRRAENQAGERSKSTQEPSSR